MSTALPHSCCVPSYARLANLDMSISGSNQRPRATNGSLEDMVKLDGGPFWMGSESLPPSPLTAKVLSAK